jgi:hypothetical protein
LTAADHAGSAIRTRNKSVTSQFRLTGKITPGDVPDSKEVIMVGGFFDGDEKSIATVAERIEFEADHNVSEYSEETVKLFQLTATLLNCAGDMVKRIDYLLNGDEDEDTFLALWAERFGAEESEEGEEEEGEDEQTDD